MTNSRPSISGRDVAGAGALLLSVNLVCAGIGAGLGALVGLTIPLMLVGFFVGFFLGIYVVSRRFHDL
jgi:F0F1-type ATP synthase assembly protein I